MNEEPLQPRHAVVIKQRTPWPRVSFANPTYTRSIAKSGVKLSDGNSETYLMQGDRALRREFEERWITRAT
jgi:hypothetical protein